MRQPNGCSTPAPKSSAAKQWIKEELAQKKEAAECLVVGHPRQQWSCRPLKIASLVRAEHIQGR